VSIILWVAHGTLKLASREHPVSLLGGLSSAGSAGAGVCPATGEGRRRKGERETEFAERAQHRALSSMQPRKQGRGQPTPVSLSERGHCL